MTAHQAKDCMKAIEARFGMIGRYWSEPIANQYLNLLIGYDEPHAKQVIASILRQQNVPPSDFELEVLLNSRPAQDAAKYKQPIRGDYNAKNGKRIFEQAFRENHASLARHKYDAEGKICRVDGQQYTAPIVIGYGVEVPEEWENRFAKWRESNATDEQIGRDLLGTASDVFLDEDPFEEVPKMTAERRAAIERELLNVRVPVKDSQDVLPASSSSALDMEEWTR